MWTNEERDDGSLNDHTKEQPVDSPGPGPAPCDIECGPDFGMAPKPGASCMLSQWAISVYFANWPLGLDMAILY